MQQNRLTFYLLRDLWNTMSKMLFFDPVTLFELGLWYLRNDGGRIFEDREMIAVKSHNNATRKKHIDTRMKIWNVNLKSEMPPLRNRLFNKRCWVSTIPLCRNSGAQPPKPSKEWLSPFSTQQMRHASALKWPFMSIPTGVPLLWLALRSDTHLAPYWNQSIPPKWKRWPFEKRVFCAFILGWR
jgi:hypothetical protein